MLLTEAVAIGLVLGFFCYEWTGFSPGGFVVPGYVALYWDRPAAVAVTLGMALAVYFAVEGVSRVAVVYGRRRFTLAVLLGFALHALVRWAAPGAGAPIEGDVIGAIIPGLIANEMARQRVIPTACTLVGLSAAVRLILIALGRLTP
jgi:poly-gamma-glutamate biosynthesis protein PgsC/CapC